MENTAPTAPLIFAAMVKAMASIGHIGKDRRNTQQNYSFRGIDDLYNAVHPALVDAQIFICPSVTNREHQERQSNAGGVLFYETLTVEHKFYTIDGSFVTVTTMGSAMDSGDKAVNKAMSAAMKYALLEVFAIPTEGDNDTENHSPDVAPRRQEPARPTVATVVKQPAVAQDTMAAKSLTPSQTVATTAATDEPSKEDIDQLYFQLIGKNGAMHQNYLPLVKAIYTGTETAKDRYRILNSLLTSVRNITKVMGAQQARNMLEDITLGMTIDRKNPTTQHAHDWFENIVHMNETGAVPTGDR